MKRVFLLAGATACLAALSVGAPALAQSTGARLLPRTEVQIGFYRLEVEVAATPQDREQGLMHRQFLPQQQGMLFVFPRPDRYCMWMKNTLIPLSVAFLDAEGKVINFADMQPQSEESHCARAPALYALEVNQGWFVAKGIRPGAKVSGIR